MDSIINLLCGIGLFLCGIFMMSESTEKAFGEKLKGTLEALSRTRLRATLTGLAVTGIIQSSAATTVMAVSFVSAGLMTLEQTVGIIMGANIGTTVTSLLIAFNFSSIAPLCIFLAVAIRIFARKERTRFLCDVLCGFGLLFLGMNTMSLSFSHLKNNAQFLSLVASCTGKLPCIAVGFIMTAILQSSSATVGILQALALSGLVESEAALYIIFGQNIGAVIPTILSAVGASKQAKQVGMIHLLFNIIGAVLFAVVFIFVPFPEFIKRLGNGSVQVSFMHIAFNVISTIIMLPFGDELVWLSGKLQGQKQQIKAGKAK